MKTKKKTLLQIEEKYLAIMFNVEESGGELTEELDAELTLNEKELAGKSLSYIEFIGNQESFEARIADEIKRLQALKKTTSNRIGWLKEKLLQAVKIFGPYKAGLHKVGTRQSSAVEIFDADLITNDYKVRKITEAPDKAMIKDALKNGASVPGAVLVNKLHLKIS